MFRVVLSFLPRVFRAFSCFFILRLGVLCSFSLAPPQILAMFSFPPPFFFGGVTSVRGIVRVRLMTNWRFVGWETNGEVQLPKAALKVKRQVQITTTAKRPPPL